MNKKTISFFNKFKSYKISGEELKKANSLLSRLGGVSGGFKALTEMCSETLKGNFKLSGTEWGILVGAIIYVVSPLDAVPDFIPFLGFSDDISLILLVLKSLSSALERFTLYKEAKLKVEEEKENKLS